MGCNKYLRQFCLAEQRIIEGHKRRTCLKCKAIYQKEFRKRKPLTEEQKIKANCRAYAKVYLKRGKIKKKRCLICESENSQMHHEDYSKPLDVIWLCRPCHLAWHKK